MLSLTRWFGSSEAGLISMVCLQSDKDSKALTEAGLCIGFVLALYLPSSTAKRGSMLSDECTKNLSISNVSSCEIYRFKKVACVTAVVIMGVHGW